MRPNKGIGLHQGTQDLNSGLSPKIVLIALQEKEKKQPMGSWCSYSR